ncbi:hypothetical protein N8737_01050 [Verrucomicrobia bacterium]|nr:hypothetical protein [Verrucomicrobiota bacterium]
MKRVEKPIGWSDRERIGMIRRLLYRISAERLNVERRSRLISFALDVADGAPELLDRRWLEMECILRAGEPKGMTW